MHRGLIYKADFLGRVLINLCKKYETFKKDAHNHNIYLNERIYKMYNFELKVMRARGVPMKYRDP